MWLPFMILPIQAAIERIPGSLHRGVERPGRARRAPTFRQVILPLAMPGVAAGSIFTFSLTLGDYIIPQVIGDSTLFIGQVVYRQQGVAGNIPFAAAFSTGADRGDRRVSVDREEAGGVRCALSYLPP